MPWPTPQDYNEAVQNPRLAFRDPDLQAARPQEDTLGLPRAIGGQFASVYKMAAGSGRMWAVRCFLREFRDQQRRYDAISRELTRLNLPYTVGFKYQPDGICVRGNRFPLLKMAWVQGESLTRYVGSRLGQPVLRELAEKVVVMARRLADTGVAHGDLQHGNILVGGGEPRLIDYDGMFVPAMAGWRSHEVGHPNFQHPRRTDADFGPRADNFSVWVIYLSLLALSADAGLWSRHGGGDECLLFRRTDFEQPDRSKLLRDLDRSADPLVAALAATFRSFLCLAPLQIPLIDRQGVRPPASRQTPAHTGSTIPEWLRDQVNQTPGTEVSRPVVDLGWLMDNWDQTNQIAAEFVFGNSPWPDRITWTVTLVGLVVAVVMHLSGLPVWEVALMATAAVFSAVAFSWSRYANDPGVQKLRQLVGQAAEATREVREASKEVLRREGELKKLLGDLDNREAELQAKIAEARVQKQNALATIDQTLASEKAGLQWERNIAQRDLDAGLHRVRDRVAQAVATIDRQIRGLDGEEAAERGRLLSQKQDEHIKAALRKARVIDAEIHDVGPKRKEWLVQNGFVTAADINRSVRRVQDIGAKRGEAILAWRSAVEARAERTKPTAITPDEERVIRDRIESHKATLLVQREKEQLRWRTEEQAVHATHSQTMYRLIQEESAKHHDAEASENQIQTKIRAVIEEAQQKLDQLRQERQSPGVSQTRNLCAEARQAQASANWRKARLEHQVAIGRARLSLLPYVKRVLGIS